MEIYKISKSPVNELIMINLVRKDYEQQYQKEINKKMPLATVKGFKKGKAPRDLVQQQYGLELKINVVNKIVDQELAKFIESENFDFLGTPLYVETDEFDWNNDTLVFQYEIGLAPKFDLNLEGIEITHYEITADDAMIDAQVTRIQKQYGTLQPTETIEIDSEIEAHFENLDEDIDITTPFELTVFKNQETKDLFIGKKVGDTVIVNTKNLFEDNSKLSEVFNIPEDVAFDLETDLTVIIKAINTVSNAELNQDLFDQLYGKDNIKTIDEMRAKIGLEAETYFKTQNEQKFNSDLILKVVEKNNFELPQNFLTRWLQTAGKTDLTIQEAIIEYSRSENALRYQLIEPKIIDLIEDRLTFDDLKSHATTKIKDQMIQYGYNATDDEVESIVAKTLSNQDEIRKLSNEVMKIKALDIVKSKATITTKKVNFDQYIKELNKE